MGGDIDILLLVEVVRGWEGELGPAWPDFDFRGGVFGTEVRLEGMVLSIAGVDGMGFDSEVVAGTKWGSKLLVNALSSATYA